MRKKKSRIHCGKTSFLEWKNLDKRGGPANFSGRGEGGKRGLPLQVKKTVKGLENGVRSTSCRGWATYGCVAAKGESRKEVKKYYRIGWVERYKLKKKAQWGNMKKKKSGNGSVCLGGSQGTGKGERQVQSNQNQRD